MSSKARRYLDLVATMDESLQEHDKKYHPEGYHEGDKCNKRETMAKTDKSDDLDPQGESRKDERGDNPPNLEDIPDAPEPKENELERTYKFPKMSIMREINAMGGTRVKMDYGDVHIEDAYFYDITPFGSDGSIEISSNCGRELSVDALVEAAKKGKMFKAWNVELIDEKRRNGKHTAFLTKKNSTEGDDADYLNAVKNGEAELVKSMLLNKAKQSGYSQATDYRSSHHAPMNDGYNASLVDVKSMFGTHERNELLRMGYGRATSLEAVDAIMKAKGNPDALIDVYRAVPKDVQDTNLRQGDWVSLSQGYARQHGESVLDGKYKIIKAKVPAKHIFTDGNMLEEAGFDDGQERVYKDAKNGTKLLGITYDDNGEVIPLSKRFDMSNPDIRY